MFTKKPLFESLRDIIHLSRNAESLDDLPDRLERIVQAYSSQAIHPQFRSDIFEILNASAQVAEALANTTYNAQDAIRRSCQLLQILARIITHLECERPGFQGYGIMMQPSKELYPNTWPTEDGASKVVEYLQKDRSSTHYEVVPIRITSDITMQPTLPMPTTEIETEPRSEPDPPDDDYPQVVKGIPEGSPITRPIPVSDFVQRFNHQLKLEAVVPQKET